MMLIPANPELTVERSSNGVPIRYCIDATTERTMQNQRLVAMAVAPVLVYGAYRMSGPWWLRIAVGGSGVACLVTQFAAYRAVRQAEKF